VHCAFSGNTASQAITAKAVPVERLSELNIVRMACEDSAAKPTMQGGDEIGALQISSRRGEFAILGFQAQSEFDEYEEALEPEVAELKILGEYFHSHMLRRNGIDTSEALVVSARELDCLRWVAAGKSAWEASVILGISERTVRFHLNSAREKLNCTTTTQAVAKVVAQQLIAV
jgi:DNA-binding CsgD family transcriptional regulator